MKIGVLGSGDVGKVLAARLAELGHEPHVGRTVIALKRGGFGLATLCVGGGQGAAVVVESLGGNT